MAWHGRLILLSFYKAYGSRRAPSGNLPCYAMLHLGYFEVYTKNSKTLKFPNFRFSSFFQILIGIPPGMAWQTYSTEFL